MSHSTLHPAESAELRAHAERAAKARQEGLQLLHDPRSQAFYATSKSRPGTLHRVTLLSCDCLGFIRHGHCRHHSAIVMAHLLKELDSAPALVPADRRGKTCERMAAPTPKPATPERGDVRVPGTGELVGHVVVEAWTIEAWGYDVTGEPLLLWSARRTDADARNIAADRIWRHVETTGLMAPKAIRFKGRVAA